MEEIKKDIERLEERQDADHDSVTRILIVVNGLSTTLEQVRSSVDQIKSMCSNRLPHCMNLFTTEKRLIEEKKEIFKKFDSRDTLAKWAIGLAITNFIMIIGVIIQTFLHFIK